MSAAMTPGTQPMRVSRNTINTDPQPRSITAKGGKIIANSTCKQLISLICLTFAHKLCANLLLFFYIRKKKTTLSRFFLLSPLSTMRLFGHRRSYFTKKRRMLLCISKICSTFGRRLAYGNSPESTFAKRSELQINRKKSLIHASIIRFFAIYLVLQIFCSTFVAV